MKKSLFLLMLTASLGAYAANHEIKMLDNGKDGSMVFEPGYVNAKVGDTVTFKATNSGHWVQSKALPDGVADFLSEDGKDFTLKLDKEGVYVYTCPPHRMMNMSGVIQVGKPVNKAKAQAVVDELENRAMQSKGRLKNTCSRSNKPPHKTKRSLKPLSRFQTTFCQSSSPILIPLPPKSSRSENR